MRGAGGAAPASDDPVDRYDDDHRPALDGLRAVAVCTVVLFHLDRLPGGNLGVDAFFVLSGWLITSRLLAEADRSPRATIALRRFWVARIRRLLPASVLVILTVSIVWSAAGIVVPSLRRDLLWALGWSSNWGTISGGGDYWARFGEPSPVTHFWSLAIEEQFYLIWPLILAAVLRWGGPRRRVAIGAISATLALASVAFMATTFDPIRPTATYMHTFARAHTLLLGAAAAAVPASSLGRLRTTSVARWAPRVAAVAAAVLVLAASDRADWLYSWGFPAFALAMVVIVVAAAEGTWGRALASPPMRWLGERSYGIYLWHWPVILLLSARRSPIGGVPLDLARIGLSLALAAASYRWLEMPIRRVHRPAARRAPGLVIGALAASAVLVASHVPGQPGVPAPPAVSVQALPTEPAFPFELVAAHSLSSLPTHVPAELVLVAVSRPLAGPVRVLVAGDSTAVHLAEALLDYAADHRDRIVAGSAAYAGCGLTAATDGRRHEFSNPDGSRQLVDLSGCTWQWTSIVHRVPSEEQIDVVLMQMGAWDAEDIHLSDGQVMSVADPAGRRAVADSYQRFVTDVEAAGARVVWVRPPDVHLGWDAIDAPVNDPERWRSMRRIIDGLPVEQIDLPTWLLVHELEGPEGRPDGVHLTPDANARFVADLVAPTLLSLADDAAPASRPGRPPPPWP